MNHVWAVVGLALAVTPLSSAWSQGAGGDQPPPAVIVAEIKTEDVTNYREFIGRVEAIEDVALRARVPGFIMERRFEEGTLVSKGDVLYLIERNQYETDLASAQAELASAEASRREARRELERNMELYEDNVVAESSVDDARAAFESADADVLAAQSAVDRAELDLDYTTITAPIDGKIGETMYTAGNFVELASGTLARIVQLDPIRVVFSLSDRDFVEFQQDYASAKGTEMMRERFIPQLRLPNGEMYGGEGEIAFVGNVVDSSTGTVPVRARFANPQNVLLPGQFVSVVVQIGEKRVEPTTPFAAVQRDRDGSFVFVVGDDDKVEERRIELGANIGDAFVIKDGLEAGERVIVAGIQKVSPGAAVSASFRDGDEAGGDAASSGEADQAGAGSGDDGQS
ncbi:MAG: efflux RND transporter periplasmic adaptor subunit [Geminicoccaceae bacterium]